MYTVIAYNEAMQGNALIRVYEDSTEKGFESQEDASEYFNYLSAKNLNSGVDMYEKKIYVAGELDVTELKRQDALNKLTQEDKDLLGIQ